MTHDQIKEQAVDRIYLFPGEHDGETTLLWGDDPAPGEGMDPAEAVEYLRKDVHDAIIAKQAIAARQGMDAAKKVAGSNLEQAKRLHAESNPEALESERAANAQLTEQIAKLEAHISSLKDDIEIHRAAEETQIALRQKADEREAALAAHLERAKAAVEQLENDCFAEDIEFPEMFDFLRDEDETPVTSLDRRDALKQAEVLEQVFKRWMHRATAEEILGEINFMIQNRRREIETQQ